MNSNSIVAAPVLANPLSRYDEWHQENHGTRHDFLKFLMCPGVERDRFLARRGVEIANVGSVVVPVCRV